MRVKKIYKNSSGFLLYVSIFFLFIIRDFENLSLIYKIRLKIKDMKQKESYYKKEIEKLKIQCSNFEDPVLFEKYVREKFYLKKPNEDIIFIEYENINNKQNQ